MHKTYIRNTIYVKGVLRLSKKVCSKCGIEKDLYEFYTRKDMYEKYGKDDVRSYRKDCIDCCSKAAKKQRENRMNYTKGLYFVYFVSYSSVVSVSSRPPKRFKVA